MGLLVADHAARIFLEEDRFALDHLQQRLVIAELLLLVLQAFRQDVVDRVLVRLQQRGDLQRRVAAERGDMLAGEVSVGQ